MGSEADFQRRPQARSYVSEEGANILPFSSPTTVVGRERIGYVSGVKWKSKSASGRRVRMIEMCSLLGLVVSYESSGLGR